MLPFTPTSTLLIYASDSVNYIWASISGFFFTANGSQFTIVVIIAIGTVCIVVAGIKSVISNGINRRHM